MTRAVRVAEMSKCFRIGERQTYGGLGERVSDALSASWRRLRGGTASSDDRSDDLLWALKDVTFDVEQGELVGIIGRNGAGKTTLLKILSRITRPTSGTAEIRGSVGSLLEVGTGIHDELTGRENIYLNGAVLGMRKTEITNKFEDIVDFSGIANFIDTPVKKYSSGMRVRLAFAVAAHRESDILLVDEILAVGDAEFQKKCLGRMEDIGAAGRTVLFVSHSMQSILRLCPRVILLDGGKLVADGKSHEVIRAYLESGSGTTARREWEDQRNAPGDDVVRLKAIRVRTDGRIEEEVPIGRPVEVEIEYWHISEDPKVRPCANLHFYNEDGVCLFVTSDQDDVEWRQRPRETGIVKAICRIPGNFLAEGRVFVHAAVSTLNPTVIHVLERDAVAFQVVDRSTGEGVRGEYVADWPGVVRPRLDWTIDFEPEPVPSRGVS